MFQEQQHASTKVQPDPRVVQYQQFRWIYWLNPLWMFLYAFMQFATHGFSVAALPLWDQVFCSLFLLLALLNVILLPYQHQRFQRLASRRIAAARGDARLLADPHPLSNATAMSLPFTINALPRASTRTLVVLGIVFGVVIALLTATIALLIATSRAAGHASVVHVSMFAVLTIIIIAVVMAVLLVLFVRQHMAQQKIIFTEHGVMQLGSASQVHSISWREVRLFCCDTPTAFVPLNNQHLPLTFQIASANAVVQWYWMCGHTRSGLPFGNSREAYSQQMQELLSLIAARARVPLYDLNKKSSSE